MQIKTITCHDVYNYGASLQAYALMKYLQNKGHEVEIINYKPEYLSVRYNYWHIRKCSRCKNLYERFIVFHLLYALREYRRQFSTRKRKRPFDHFKKKYLNITKRKFESNNDLKKYPLFADLYIAGSDQIWNTDFPNGKDAAFYLDFVPKNGICISYAASFATERIAKGYESFVKEKLGRFSHVSVRETTGLRILESLGIKNGVLVLDPVFLLTTDQWQKLIRKKHNEKYILVYDFLNDDPEIEATTKMLASKNGWKIYSLNDYIIHPYADKNISNAGPLEFLEWIFSAQMIISNSFHATAFSVIFEKQFYVFGLKSQNNSTRMIDFLSLINLPERYIESKDCIKDDDIINYDKTNKLLQTQIQISYDYLSQTLSQNH